MSTSQSAQFVTLPWVNKCWKMRFFHSFVGFTILGHGTKREVSRCLHAAVHPVVGLGWGSGVFKVEGVVAHCLIIVPKAGGNWISWSGALCTLCTTTLALRLQIMVSVNKALFSNPAPVFVLGANPDKGL